jgi:acid phosphatase type 7
MVLVGMTKSTGASSPLIRGPYLQLATPTNLVVRWRTVDPTDSVVRFGRQWTNLNETASNATLTAEHEVRITGLAPDTRYYYGAGASAEPLAGSPDLFFTTAPTNPRPVRVWVTGDTRQSLNGGRADVRDAYLEFVGDRPADLMLNTGDLADMGWDEELQAAFFDVYASPMRHTVAYACLGNHDLGIAQGQAFVDSFTLPANGEAGGAPSASSCASPGDADPRALSHDGPF